MSGYERMELIYRGSSDGTTSKIFHNKCDNIGTTIILYKNDKGNIYLGYCPIKGIVMEDFNLLLKLLFLH